jgi:nucleotide-binding universal stress UspA family protein
MRRFKNILVGVDLSRRDRLVGKNLNRPASRGYESALQLAKANHARLHFLSTLEVSLDAQRGITTARGQGPTLLDEAEDRMRGLVAKANNEGIAATGSVVFGKSWEEIIRQVLRGKHDLVVVGTRHLGTLKSTLLGSIGIQLLRKCPCPVWISKSRIADGLSSILLANDQTPVGQEAMELAASLAHHHKADLQVLHSPQGALAGPSYLSAEGGKEIKENIQLQIEQSGLTRGAQVKVVQRTQFCKAISDHIDEHRNQLLVLGTQACTGILKMLKRERSERLLSGTPCSLLALKPESFVSPISLDQSDSPAPHIGAA